MVKTAQELENTFKLVGIARRGRPECADDDGYWTGGKCNWGGYHNLAEDCQTLANGLNKVESLNGKSIHDELTKCTNKQEFDSKKSTLLMKANESINGLRPRTGYSSSMFGICIIWADEANSKLVEREMENGRKELADAKGIIERTDYSWAEEIKELTAEIRKIEMGMEEKKKKALDPNLSPSEKLAILEEIEEDGKLLQTKYEERNQLTNRFKHIDPSKYVSRMIGAMKKAIERSNGGGSGDNKKDPNKPRKPNRPDDPFSGGNDGNGSNNLPDDNGSNRTPRQRNQPEQNNQQMLLIGVAVLVVIFFLMNQKEQSNRQENYDYDY